MPTAISQSVDITVGSTLTEVSAKIPAVSMISGNTYKINDVGSPILTNWTVIGAATDTVGTVFVYNGTAVTGDGSVDAAIEFDSKISIYVVNKSGTAGNFRLAISPATPTGGEYLYYDFPLKANGTFIAADVYVKAKDRVWVYSPVGWSAKIDGVTLV